MSISRAVGKLVALGAFSALLIVLGGCDSRGGWTPGHPATLLVQVFVDTGEPAPDTQVSVAAVDVLDPPPTLSRTTGTLGAVQFNGLSAGLYLVTVDPPPGYLPGGEPLSRQVQLGGTPLTTVVFRLRKAAD